MVDYNQSLSSVAEALHRGRALDERGLLWIEEPIRHDDYASYKVISRELKTPHPLGENFNGPEAVLEASESVGQRLYYGRRGADWRRHRLAAAAGIAAASGIEMSSHLMP